MAFGNSDELAISATIDGKGVVTVLDEMGKKIDALSGKSSAAGAGLSKFQANLLSLQAGLQLTGQAFSLVTGAAQGIGDLLERGSAIDDVATSFERLAAQSGAASTTLLSGFGAAIDNTLPKLDQMRQMNELMVAGIAPDNFEMIAKAARSLSEVTGGDLTQSMESLSDSLLRGNDRALKMLGIYVDNKKALRDFAEAHKPANMSTQDFVDGLTEEGQRLAMTEAMLEAMRQKQGELGEVTTDAGDRIAQLSSSLVNAKDEMAKAAANNVQLNKFLDEMNIALNSIDWGPIMDGMGTLIGYFDSLTKYLAEGTQMIPGYFSALKNAIDNAMPGNILTKFGASLSNPLNDWFRNLIGVSTESQAVAAQTSTAWQTGIAGIDSVIAPLNQSVNNMSVSFESAAKTAVKATSAIYDGTNKAKEGAQKAAQEAERMRQEYQAFDQKLRGMLGTGPVAQFTEEIKAAFDDDTIKGTDAFIERLDAIAREAQAAKVPLGDLLSQIEEIKRSGISGGIELGPAVGEDADFFQKYSGLSTVGQGIADMLGTETLSGLSDIAAFEEIGGQVASDLFNGLQSGMTGQDYADLAGQIGGDIGGALGAEFGPIGEAVGSFLGQEIIGGVADFFVSEDSEGTKARKAADKYFADLFDANHLSIIVGGELREMNDLVFNGNTFFGGAASLHDGPANDYLNTLTSQAQAAFKGVGAAFEQIIGLPKEFDGYLAGALANNLGSLNNLQLAIEATGKSLEDLEQSAMDAFLSMRLSAEDAQAALEAMQATMQEGIPDAFGAVDEAWKNWHTAGWEGGRALLDGMRDVGAELIELGVNTIPGMADALVNRFGFAANEVAAFMEAMKNAGIKSVADLAKATNDQLLAMASNMQKYEETGTVGTSAAVVIHPSTSTSRSSGTSRSTGKTEAQKKAEDAAKERKRAAEELRNETMQALEGSNLYAEVIEKVTKKEIARTEAQKILKQQYDQIYTWEKKVNKLEKKRDEDLLKGGKHLAEYTDKIERYKKNLADLSKEAEKAKSIELNSEFLDFVQKFAENTEAVAAAANLAGVSFDSMKQKAMQGFLSGAQTAREALKAIEDVGPGVAGQTGAVAEEVRRILQYGTHGGIMTANAIRGLAKETKELGGTSIDNLAEAMRGQGVDEDMIGKIMASIKNAGVDSLDALLNASDETAIRIQAQMEDIGVPLSNTSEAIRKVTEELSQIPAGKKVEIELTTKWDKKTEAIMIAYGLWPGGSGSSPSDTTTIPAVLTPPPPTGPGLQSRRANLRAR